jgi:hypothetical protein
MFAPRLPLPLLWVSLSCTCSLLAAPQGQVEQPSGVILAPGSATVTFGAVHVGDSGPKTFVVRNHGDAELFMGGITLGGPDLGDFSLVVAPDSPVAPGASTFFRVKFEPGSTGDKSANLSFTTN